jgi:hypothetical protein
MIKRFFFTSLVALLLLAELAYAAEFRLGGPMPSPPQNVPALIIPVEDDNLASSLIELSRPLKDTMAAIQGKKVDDAMKLRGGKEAALYNELSRSVVLLLTEDGSGSGSVIDSSGSILTNWHVVKGHQIVKVIYKPLSPEQDEMQTTAYTGQVVKIDQVADLALVKVLSPDNTRKPIEIANKSASVGADTHAIGHPLGYNWSYTKGFVSALRSNQQWTYDIGYQHLANTVQTQTPINPGNSGGPLLNDTGELIGVNSYKSSGDGLNFAVASSTVKSFLARENNRFSPRIPGTEAMAELMAGCKSKVISDYIDEELESRLIFYDLNCDGDANSYMKIPVDETEAIVFFFDTIGDGREDVVLIDADRDEKWDISFYDVTGNGEHDIVGYHGDDGGYVPHSYTTYARFQYQLKDS